MKVGQEVVQDQGRTARCRMSESLVEALLSCLLLFERRRPESTMWAIHQDSLESL